MFDKKDLMISLNVVESKIREIELNYNTKIKENTEYFSNMINLIKNNCKTKGILKPDYLINNEFLIGIPTNIYNNGIQLFTGDEVITSDGRKGFIAIQNDTVIIMTNYHRYSLHDKNNINIEFKILRNFNEYSINDVIALGRNDGKGFIVKELTLSL